MADRAPRDPLLARLHRLDARWTRTTAAAWLGVPARTVTTTHRDRLAQLVRRAGYRHDSEGAQAPGAVPAVR